MEAVSSRWFLFIMKVYRQFQCQHDFRLDLLWGLKFVSLLHLDKVVPGFSTYVVEKVGRGVL